MQYSRALGQKGITPPSLFFFSFSRRAALLNARGPFMYRMYAGSLFQIGVTRCYSESNSESVLLGVDTRDYLTANLRELTRIAFSLRSGALLRLMRANRRFACRLKWALPIWASPTQESHPLLKNAIGKTRVRVFLMFHYFFDYTNREVYGEKNRHAGFSPAFVQEPKALETSHELSARGLFQTACDSA